MIQNVWIHEGDFLLLDQETTRFVFGIKLRGLRLDRGLSLKELSRKTSLSPSYLNEIEKGKKSPKTEKIQSLATALEIPYDDLVSLKLKKELQLVSQLLEKNVFSGMPFDIFGIPAATVFELLADRPKKMGALIGTLLEIARAHDVTIDDFFYATLRSYLDMHQNYFPGIEEKAESFRRDFEWPTEGSAAARYQWLCDCLTKDFGVRVVEQKFDGTDLSRLFYFVKADPKGAKTLYVNQQLSLNEKVLIAAREVGFQYLRIKSRPTTSWIKNLDSFEQLFNHFSASYFASAICIPRDSLVIRLRELLGQGEFNSQDFAALIRSYPVPIESVFHRMTQLLPKFLGLDQLFFLRVDQEATDSKPKMIRELHLSALHAPHSAAGDETYCSRWITTRLLREAGTEGFAVGVQRSFFPGSGHEYLNLACSFKGDLVEGHRACVTLGFLLNAKAQEAIRFVNSPQIPRKEVSQTCERCPIKDCNERRVSQRWDLDPDAPERVRLALEAWKEN